MTREQYQAKYGQTPSTQPTQPQKPSFMQNVGSDVKNIWEGVKSIPKYLYNKATDPSNIGQHPMKPVLSIGKDLVKGTVQEYNELAGRPFEGGDFVKRASDRAYEKPVTTALDLLPGVGFLKKLKGASKVDDVARVNPKLIEQADKIATRGLGNPARQTRAELKAGRSTGSFIDEYDLYDRSPEKAREVVKNIGSKFDDTAMQSGKQIPTQQILQSFDDEIARLTGGRTVIADSVRNQIDELARRKQMFVDSFSDGGALPETIGLDEATTFRRQVIDPDVPKSEFGLNPKDTGKAGGVKSSRDIFRRESIGVAPELEKLGLDYGMAKEVERIIEASAARAGNRQLLNFSKMGSAGIGAFLQGVPGLVGGFLTEQFVNSPAFLRIVSKSLRKMATTAPKTSTPPLFSKNAQNAVMFGQGARLIDQTEAQTEPGIRQSQSSQSYNPIIPLFDKGKDELKKKDNIFSKIDNKLGGGLSGFGKSARELARQVPEGLKMATTALSPIETGVAGIIQNEGSLKDRVKEGFSNNQDLVGALKSKNVPGAVPLGMVGGMLLPGAGEVGSAKTAIKSSKLFSKIDDVSNLFSKKGGSEAKKLFESFYKNPKSLNPEFQKINDKFFKYIGDNIDNVSSKYWKKFGKVLNTDNIREFSEDYMGDKSLYSAAVHEPSSALTKKLYLDKLKEAPKAGEDASIYMTAGGSGAGKTSGISKSKAVQDLVKKSQMTYDSNMNKFNTTDEKIKLALDHGKDVVYIYTYRDPVEAFINGVVPRGRPKNGINERVVPIINHEDTHNGSLETFKKIIQKYQNNPKVDIHFVDNSLGKGKQMFRDLDEIKNFKPSTGLQNKLKNIVEDLYAKGELTLSEYRGYLGK
jgi:hypothetical protein